MPTVRLQEVRGRGIPLCPFFTSAFVLKKEGGGKGADEESGNNVYYMERIDYTISMQTTKTNHRHKPEMWPASYFSGFFVWLALII
jgi:hypothetical protein